MLPAAWRGDITGLAPAYVSTGPDVEGRVKDGGETDEEWGRRKERKKHRKR